MKTSDGLGGAKGTRTEHETRNISAMKASGLSDREIDFIFRNKLSIAGVVQRRGEIAAMDAAGLSDNEIDYVLRNNLSLAHVGVSVQPWKPEDRASPIADFAQKGPDEDLSRSFLEPPERSVPPPMPAPRTFSPPPPATKPKRNWFTASKRSRDDDPEFEVIRIPVYEMCGTFPSLTKWQCYRIRRTPPGVPNPRRDELLALQREAEMAGKAAQKDSLIRGGISLVLRILILRR